MAAASREQPACPPCRPACLPAGLPARCVLGPPCVAAVRQLTPSCCSRVLPPPPLPTATAAASPAPPGRFFEQQPLGKLEAGREGERRLLYWLVEDAVKKRCAGGGWGDVGCVGRGRMGLQGQGARG